MEKINILLIEDEASLSFIIRENLEQEGYNVMTARDGEEGLLLFKQSPPHLIVSDIMMPNMDGFSMVKEIRKTNTTLPILFLSALSCANDVVQGFELGGNDYLKKPFGMAELLIRIKVLLSRTDHSKICTNKNVFQFGLFTFDSAAQTLIFDNTDKQLLSNRESEILKRLCESGQNILAMPQLLQEFWGDDSLYNARCLHVFITKLRRRLSPDPSLSILNVRGMGYKLIYSPRNAASLASESNPCTPK